MKIEERTLRWGKKVRIGLAAFIFSLFSLHPVWADDTEIYQNSNIHKPNLLFILDASGSMDIVDPGFTASRLERMQAAMNTVLDTMSEDERGYNVGLMRFGGNDGGRILYPVRDLAAPGVRQDLTDAMADIVTIASTPTVGALEEAWRYFTGGSVRHGRARPLTAPNRNFSNHDRSTWTPERFSRISHPDSYTGGTVEGRSDICGDDPNRTDCANEHITGSPVYTSPIASECQANYAILLTDGGPHVGHPILHNGIAFPDIYNETISIAEELTGGPCNDGVNVGRLCGEEYAELMFRQNIVTHVIGYTIDSPWMQAVARASRDPDGPADQADTGQYFNATSASDLVTAITSITQGISAAGLSVVAPAVTIDQFTRLSHRDEVYLALFRPQASANWVGNLKKYKFNGANPALRDADGNVAIDPATGEFLPTSRSFWSTSADGGDVTSGGAAENLNGDDALGDASYESRNMYSNLEVGTSDLTAVGNRMNPGTISPEMTGAVDTVQRDEHLRWLAGEDLQDDDNDGSVDDARKHIGDPLHSNPTIVTYGLGENGDKENLDSLVFFGTNEGFLHAMDTNTGEEEYAFMPQELISNVRNLFGYGGSQLSRLQPIGARQSSTRNGGEATRAINGSTLGAFRHISITTQVQDAWWEAELAESATISDIEIWNRTDCCTDRLRNFHVFVSDTPMSNSLDVNLNDPDVWSYFHAGTLDGRSVSVPVGATGQYVRIQQTERQILNLAEVTITGVAQSAEQGGSSRVYGLDGDLTLRTIDHNNNGFIEDSESGESDKAYLYAGMRRGGKNYYALDVSKKNAPKFLWSIKGGEGDFAELGQSWSKPIVTKLKIGSDEKDVLVFGGGYDQQQDNKAQRSRDDVGRAIFIVDADTGELIWSGGNSQNQPATSTKHQTFANMEYSIPADVSIVTDPGTGYLSQMYVGDMGGRLFRFDINNGSPITDLVDGGMIADFGEDGSEAGARRFFASPDLSLFKVDNELMINISIGSGYRAHPLNTAIDDKFFVMRYPFAGHGTDYGIKVAGAYVAATLGDLFDATSNIIAEGTASQITDAKDELAMSAGWFITMEDTGEKVLDTSSTFEGVVRFVSYVPANSSDPCDPGLGHSFIYAVNLQDGTASEEFNQDKANPNEKKNRKKRAPGQGIAPPVSTIFVKHDGGVTPTDVSGGNLIHQWENSDRLQRWFWAEIPDF